MGKAAAVNLIEKDIGNDEHGIDEECLDKPSVVEVAPVSSSDHITCQKQDLRRLLKESLSLEALSLEEMDRLFIMMDQYHDVFSLKDEEQA